MDEIAAAAAAGRAPPRGRSRRQLSAGAAGQRAPRRPAGGDPRPPGRRRGRRDRLGQDDPAAEDLPRARPRRARRRSRTRSRAGSPRARWPSGSPTSSSVALGEAVGYAVRFSDRSREDTLVRLMTDGLLLAEIQRDRLLRRYDTIIVDEAHERSLNIDFLLGYLQAAAAPAAGPEADHHVGDDRPASASPPLRRRAGGRGVRPHLPGRGPLPAARRRATRDQTDAIGDAVDELLRERPGDVLVFLSGEREIRDTADALRGRLRRRRRDPAAVRAPVGGRAAARVQAARAAAASCSPPTSPRRR